MKHFPVILFVLLLFTACSNDDNGDLQSETRDPVELGSLAVGQQSRFVNFRSSCSSFQDEIEYHSDTVIWEVVAATGTSFSLREYFSPHSESLWFDTVTYEITQHQDLILLPQRDQSTLFWFYGSDSIYTNPPQWIALYQEGCRLLNANADPFIGNEIGILQEYEAGNRSIYSNYAISCVPTIFPDVEAYLLYTSGSLQASVTINSFNGSVNGWMRIE